MAYLRVDERRGGAVGPAAPAPEGVREVAPWIEKLARVGYAAKALLYATVGVLAAKAALGAGGETTDTRGAMRTVLEAPLGRALLVVIALGLIGYALWRLVEAITDPERRRHGDEGLKAVARRVGNAGRGLLHGAIAYTALRLALGNRDGRDAGGGRSAGDTAGAGGSGGVGEGGDSGQAEHWTARVLDAPAGEWIVGLVGAGIAAYGLYQLYRAYAAKLSEELDLGRLSAETGRWTIGVSRFGIAARGVVFCLIGALLVLAATRHDPQQAGGVADSLATLRNLGWWPLAVVAFGLVAYGVYELINARYRRIRAA